MILSIDIFINRCSLIDPLLGFLEVFLISQGLTKGKGGFGIKNVDFGQIFFPNFECLSKTHFSIFGLAHFLVDQSQICECNRSFYGVLSCNFFPDFQIFLLIFIGLLKVEHIRLNQSHLIKCVRGEKVLRTKDLSVDFESFFEQLRGKLQLI